MITGAGVHAACLAFIFRLDLADSTVGTLVSMYMNANNIGLPVATYILGDPTAVTPIVLMQQVIFTPMALTALDFPPLGNPASPPRRNSLLTSRFLSGCFAA